MPWGTEDAKRHTKKATTKAAKKQWTATANSVLMKTGNEGQAVRIANAAVKKAKAKKVK